MIRKVISTIALSALVSACSPLVFLPQDIMKQQQAALATGLTTVQQNADRKAAERENAELEASAKALQKIADSCAENSTPMAKNGPITQCQAIEYLAGKWHGSDCAGKQIVDIDIVGVAPSPEDIWSFKGRAKMFFPKQKTEITALVIVRLSAATGFAHMAPLHPHFGSVYETLRLDFAHIGDGYGLMLPVGAGQKCSLTLMPESKQPALPTVGIDQVISELGHSQLGGPGWFSSDQGVGLWLRYANLHAGNNADTRFYIGNRYFEIAGAEFARSQNDYGYYKFALDNYLRAAKVSQHAGVELALANMYLKGLGTSMDVNEAKRWFDLAKPTVIQARAVCYAALARRTVAQELSGMTTDTSPAELQSVEPAQIGMQIQGTRRALTSIELFDLRTTADRFTCRYHYSDENTAHLDSDIDTDEIANEEPDSLALSSDEEWRKFKNQKTERLMIAYTFNFLRRGFTSRRYIELTATPTGAGRYTLSVVPPSSFLHLGQGKLDPVLIDLSNNAGKT